MGPKKGAQAQSRLPSPEELQAGQDRPDKPRRGVLATTGNVLSKVARGYVWSLTGNMTEARESIKRSRRNVRRLLDEAFVPHREETFENAIARMQVSQHSLDERMRRMSVMAYFYGLVLLVAAILLLISPWSKDPLSHAFMTGGVVLMSFVRLLVTQFRMAQLRERRLFSLREWLRTPKTKARGR